MIREINAARKDPISMSEMDHAQNINPREFWHK